MATIDEIVTRIGRRVRRKVTSGNNLQSEIIDELLHAQDKLEEGATLPWFLKKVEARAISADAFSFPPSTSDTFLRMQDDEPVKYIDPTGVAAEDIFLPSQSELLLLLQRFPGTGAIPKEWVLDGANIIVRPKPTQAITYNVRFLRKDPTAPVEGATTLWSLHYSELLMSMTGKVIASSLRDNDATNRFEKDLSIARTEFIRSVTARQEAGQVHIMGDP